MLRIKIYVNENVLSEEIGEMFKIRKNTNNVVREIIDIKNSVLDYIGYNELNWCGHVQRMDQERLPRRILEYEEREDLLIRGCRRLQQE